MSPNLMKLWETAHTASIRKHRGLNYAFTIDGSHNHEPDTAIAVMKYICKVFGVAEPPTPNEDGTYGSDSHFCSRRDS